jgi:alpha-tubulin suppressor-like RCC1 family protein
VTDNGAQDFEAVWANQGTTCAKRSTGLHCWGGRDDGETGTGQSISQLTTVPNAPILPTVVDVAMGLKHVCAIDGEGALHCWGRQRKYQLGNNVDDSSIVTPTRINIPGDPRLIQVEASRTEATNTNQDPLTCALSEDGLLYCFGTSANDLTLDVGHKEFRTPTPIISAHLPPLVYFSLGQASACGLTRDGRTLCWGAERYQGEAGGAHDPATLVANQGAPLEGVQKLHRGNEFAYVQMADDRVLGWGLNHEGQLGLGHTRSLREPTPMLEGLGRVQSLAAAGRGGCAIMVNDRNEHDLYCWGHHLAEEDVAHASPQRLQSLMAQLDDDTRVVCGNLHCCTYTRDSDAFRCWGNNSHGQASIDPNIDPYVTYDNNVVYASVFQGQFRGIKSMALGKTVTCMVLSDDRVVCRGDHRWNQLGTGANQARYDNVDPVTTDANRNFPLDQITSLHVGFKHVCAGTNQGAFCWGQNDKRQIDLGGGVPFQDFAHQSAPDAQGPMAIGSETTCTKTSDQKILCWGDNMSGAVDPANRTDMELNAFERVDLSAAEVTQIVMGKHSGCALEAGLVKCWGDLRRGLVGDSGAWVRPLVVPPAL